MKTPWPKRPSIWLSVEGWDFLSFWVGLPISFICALTVLVLLFR
jgi:hypothetical protein